MPNPARCAVYCAGRNKRTEEMISVLCRETEAGRIELIAWAGENPLPNVAVLAPTELASAEAEYIFFLEEEGSTEEKTARRRDGIKHALPPFLLRWGRKLSAGLYSRRNLRKWEAFDGWGKPIPRHPEWELPTNDSLRALGISPDRVIPGRVLLLPDFQMEEYLRLRQQGITFVSDNCWGGLMYHTLGMEFTSPFINLMIRRGDYEKLISDLPGYLKEPLVPVQIRKSGMGGTVYPIVRVGDVAMHFNHVHSPEELASFAEKWYRRRERMDISRVFLQTCFSTAEEEESCADRFLAMPYGKIAFVPHPTERENMVFIPDFTKYGSTLFKDGLGECARACAKNELPGGSPYNYLKTYLSGRVCRREENNGMGRSEPAGEELP